MADLTACFSTGKDDWETPKELYAELDQEFVFTLDAAANEANHKCPRWFGPGGEVEDALSIDWPTDQSIFLNPPYSRRFQPEFIRHAADCAARGGSVVSLLPSRTDTRVFHEFIWDRLQHRPRVKQLRFVRGRLKFLGGRERRRGRRERLLGAPFPSMIVVF